MYFARLCIIFRENVQGLRNVMMDPPNIKVLSVTYWFISEETQGSKEGFISEETGSNGDCK